jgi:hypothetical protein
MDSKGNLTSSIPECERIWNALRLALLINAHCAEFIDDEDVREHLYHVWKEQRHLMPFATGDWI